MIFRRDRLGEEVIFNGRGYPCDYEWIKLEGKDISGSNDKSIWHQLKGRQLMAYDGRPKPEMVMQKPTDYDPMEF